MFLLVFAANKMTTSESADLGSKPEYMQKLLKIVSVFTDTVQVDITLKFTLTALWNLTDESPVTCRVFLEQKGKFLVPYINNVKANIIVSLRNESKVISE